MVREESTKNTRSQRQNSRSEKIYFEPHSSEDPQPRKKKQQKRKKPVKQTSRDRQKMISQQKSKFDSLSNIKRGRPNDLWTPERHKRYLMSFLNLMIEDPRRSITWQRWKQKCIYNHLANFIGDGIDPGQVKSHNDRKQKQWRPKSEGKTMLVMIVEELFEEFVQKEFHQDAINTLNRFQEVIKKPNEFLEYVKTTFEQHDSFMETNTEIKKDLQSLKGNKQASFFPEQN